MAYQRSGLRTGGQQGACNSACTVLLSRQQTTKAQTILACGSDRLMAWFRSKFCVQNTYNTECVVPIRGLPDFTSEDEWCKEYYDNMRCSGIKNNAQGKMIRFSYTFYNLNGAVGVITVLLVSIDKYQIFDVAVIPCSRTNTRFDQLCLTVNFLEGIITRPIVQKSRESNIPLWLTVS